MRRRTLLRAVPAVALGGTAGCTLPSFRTEPTARLARVVLANDDDTQHLLRLAIALDGESAFERTLAVEAGRSRTLRDEWPMVEGVWTVEVSLAESGADATVTAQFPPEDGRTGCYEVTVGVGADGTLRQPSGLRVGPRACGQTNPGA